MDSYILESGKIDLFVFQPKPHNIVGTIGVACKLKKLAHFSQNYGCLGVFCSCCYFLFNKKTPAFSWIDHSCLNFSVTYRLIYGICHTSFQSL